MNDFWEEGKQSKYKKYLLLSSNLNLQGFATNEFIEISWSFSIFFYLNFNSYFPNLISQLDMRLSFYWEFQVVHDVPYPISLYCSNVTIRIKMQYSMLIGSESLLYSFLQQLMYYSIYLRGNEHR